MYKFLLHRIFSSAHILSHNSLPFFWLQFTLINLSQNSRYHPVFNNQLHCICKWNSCLPQCTINWNISTNELSCSVCVTLVVGLSRVIFPPVVQFPYWCGPILTPPLSTHCLSGSSWFSAGGFYPAHWGSGSLLVYLDDAVGNPTTQQSKI